MNKVLYIDTTDFNKVTFAVAGETAVVQSAKVDPQKSYLLASELGKFLKKSQITAKSLKKIVVCSGPGSYTGVRIGLAQAQALAMAWNIPVSALERPKFIIPS